MKFDIEKAVNRANAAYFARSLILPEHEHLMRANHGFYCAYGHSWRDEKDAHDRDPNVGMVEE